MSNVRLLAVYAACQFLLFPIPIITLFWKDQIGMSLADIMVLQAIFGLAVVLCEFPSGYLAARSSWAPRCCLRGGCSTRARPPSGSWPWPKPSSARAAPSCQAPIAPSSGCRSRKKATPLNTRAGTAASAPSPSRRRPSALPREAGSMRQRRVCRSGSRCRAPPWRGWPPPCCAKRRRCPCRAAARTRRGPGTSSDSRSGIIGGFAPPWHSASPSGSPPSCDLADSALHAGARHPHRVVRAAVGGRARVARRRVALARAGGDRPRRQAEPAPVLSSRARRLRGTVAGAGGLEHRLLPLLHDHPRAAGADPRHRHAARRAARGSRERAFDRHAHVPALLRDRRSAHRRPRGSRRNGDRPRSPRRGPRRRRALGLSGFRRRPPSRRVPLAVLSAFF